MPDTALTPTSYEQRANARLRLLQEPLPHDGTLHPILASWRLRTERKRGAEATLKNCNRWLTRFQAWCDENGLDPGTLDFGDAEAYFESLLVAGMKTGTVRQALVQIRGAYRYALRRGSIAHDPTVDVILPDEPDKEPRTFSGDELRRILAECGHMDEHILILVLAFTGMRRNEALFLRWADVDFEQEQIKVLGKGSKFRLVPLHPELGWWLLLSRTLGREGDYVIYNHAHPGQPVSTSQFDRILGDIMEAAQVEGTAHVLRKTLATSLIEHDVRADIVDSILGWAPRTVRDRHYVRKSSEAMMEAMLMAYRRDPIT